MIVRVVNRAHVRHCFSAAARVVENFSIGLHIAWIFWIKSYGTLAKSVPGANEWLWGSGRMAVVNGWITLPVLVIALLIFIRLPFGNKTEPRP